MATVFASRGVAVEVVLVDNASADGTVEAVRAAFPSVVVIANRDNRGFGAANNQALGVLGVVGVVGEGEGVGAGGGDVAMGAAGGRERRSDDGGRAEGGHKGRPYMDAPSWVLLLNPDTEVDPDAIATLVAVAAGDPGVAVVGPRLRYGDGAVQPSRFRFPTPWTLLCESTPLGWRWPTNPIARRYHMADVPDAAAHDVDWLNGAALLCRAEALRAAGGFDEGFFLYSEETDLCRRLRDAGWRVRFEPSAEVVHHEGRSSDQAPAARHVHFQRSRLRYCAMHHGRAAAAWVRLGVRAEFVAELLLEALKWAVGHKRALRAGRVRAYWAVVRSI